MDFLSMFLHKCEKFFQLKINDIYALSVRLLSRFAPLFFKGLHAILISKFLGSPFITLKYWLHYPLTSLFKLEAGSLRLRKTCTRTKHTPNSDAEHFLHIGEFCLFLPVALHSPVGCAKFPITMSVCSTVKISQNQTSHLFSYSCLPFLHSCFLSVETTFSNRRI